MARRIVVVGAGGSGIPLAARLGIAGHEVTLLEAGRDESSALDAELAAAFGDVRSVRAAIPDAGTAWTYATELMAGHAYRIGRGRTFGGSSAVNGGYFQRAHPDDFARWAGLAGAEWTWEACLGALRRLESDQDFPDSPVHGAEGPMPVARSAGEDAVTRAFVAGAVRLGAAVEEDKNSGGPSGVGALPCNALHGERWGTNRAYGPLLQRGAVRVLAGRDARRVLLSGDRAVGVETIGPEGLEAIEADEIILCAGGIETPRLLMRSGLGESTGHAGVGRGLSDHAGVSVSWLARAGALPPAPPTAWTAAWNSPAATIAVHPLEFLLPVLSTAAIVTGRGDAGGTLDLRVTLSSPTSRGVVAAPHADGIDIRYGYLSAPSEGAALRAGIRAALALLTDGPMAEVVESVELIERFGGNPSEDELDSWMRAHLATSLHSVGTARMGDAADPDAVVDAHGRVHRIAGLRVADASILPVVPSRGTSNTAVMLGERIAELMAEE